MSRKECTVVGLVLLLWVLFTIHITDRLEFAVGTATTVIILFLCAIRYREQRRRLLSLAMFSPVPVILLSFGLNIVRHITHRNVDAVFSQVDGGRSIAAYQWFQQHPALAVPLFIVYMSLSVPLAFSAVHAQWKSAIGTILASTALAPLFYLAFPAVGPGFIQDATAPPNCMPSLHVTWAILCASYFPQRWRWPGFVFALLTACSTISTGEHYLLDVLAAVPYSLIFIAAERAWAKRNRSMAFSTVSQPVCDAHGTVLRAE